MSQNKGDAFYRFRSLIDWDETRFLSEMEDIKTNSITAVHYSKFNDPFEFQIHKHPKASEAINGFTNDLISDISQQSKEFAILKDQSPIFESGKILTLHETLEEVTKFLNFSQKESSKEVKQKVHQLFTCLIGGGVDPTCISFAKEIESIYYWSHYAKSHFGYAIEVEFDPTKRQFGDPSLINAGALYPREVKYLSENNSIDVNHIRTVQDTYFIKSNDWAMEKEYRLIGPSSKEFIRYPLNNIGKITGIYLGCRFFENLSNRQQHLIDVARIDPSIKLYKMKLNLGKLKLEVELL